MILVAGGTGTLGSRTVRHLTARGLPVRVLVRAPGRLAPELHRLVELAAGDVSDVRAVERAVRGVRTVVSAITGFGPGGVGPDAVDDLGNRTLIQAARAAGVEHVVLISIVDAHPDHPLDLNRAKYRAERALLSSGLAWTIIRPTALMETWLDVVGRPFVKTGKATIFGSGDNPVNFVAAADVAHFVEHAVTDPSARGLAWEVGGPENLTLHQFVQIISSETGTPVRLAHVPRLALQAAAVLGTMIKHPMGRMAAAAVAMDTSVMGRQPDDVWRRYPGVAPTSLRELVRATFPPETR